jgi:DhnA family fructose-bisphosphate aldolase class Ia
MSSTTGKHIRLNRVIEAQTRTCLIVAIDHGKTSPRFLPGLFDTGARVEQAIAGGANVLMLGRGMAKAHAQHFRRGTSLALMLTASAAGRPSGASITPVGCSVGRNVFEHPSTQAMTAAIGRIFRDGWLADQAHQELQSALQVKG